jgi:hypothetical protein|tara:strand:- start:167 stop:451 length:285 start_codon:yes stop_codon:yes gene_type:complete
MEKDMAEIINPTEAVKRVFTDLQIYDMEALGTKDVHGLNFNVAHEASKTLEWKTAMDILANIALNDIYLYKAGGVASPHLRSAVLACVDRVKRG